MNNGLYEHLRVFVAIAQARSLTAASIATGIGQATISRQLLALEDYLGCRLFHRSTRSISLTEQGEVYLPHALQILDMMSVADTSVQDKKARFRGRIRVACSNGFGRKLLIPALPRWQQMHPDVKLDLILSDQLSQVVEERVDVAFRLAALPDSNLVARPIGTSQRIVVASAAYLNKHGNVLEPAHLQKHQCILFSGIERADMWRFNGPRGMSSTHVQARLSLSTMDAIYDAVLADLGIAVMPAWFWTRELLDGLVRQILPDYTQPTQVIHAITTARQSSGKVRALTDYMQAVLKENGMAQE